MVTGKLYRYNDEQFIANVNYQFQHETPQKWWGELLLTEYMRINDGAGYILELEDNRKGKCTLNKRVNRAVTGIPPRYIYRFSGTGEFK